MDRGKKVESGLLGSRIKENNLRWFDMCNGYGWGARGFTGS